MRPSIRTGWQVLNLCVFEACPAHGTVAKHPWLFFSGMVQCSGLQTFISWGSYCKTRLLCQRLSNVLWATRRIDRDRRFINMLVLLCVNMKTITYKQRVFISVDAAAMYPVSRKESWWVAGKCIYVNIFFVGTVLPILLFVLLLLFGKENTSLLSGLCILSGYDVSNYLKNNFWFIWLHRSDLSSGVSKKILQLIAFIYLIIFSRNVLSRRSDASPDRQKTSPISNGYL